MKVKKELLLSQDSEVDTVLHYTAAEIFNKSHKTLEKYCVYFFVNAGDLTV